MAKSKTFVNRHGKKVRVQQDEVVTPANTEQTPEQKSAPRVRRLRFSRPHFRVPKKLLLVLAVLLVGVLGVGLLTADSIKRDYESQTAAMRRSVTEQSKQSFSDETSPKDQLQQLKNALNAPSDCRVEGIDVVSWYGPAKQAREACQSTAETYKKLQTSLDDMHRIASYSEEYSRISSPALAAPVDGQFAVIPEYVDKWQQASDELAAVEPPQALQNAHDTIRAKTTKVLESWQQLQATNGSQDEEGFRQAETALATSYDEYRSATLDIQTLASSVQSSILRYTEELSL